MDDFAAIDLSPDGHDEGGRDGRWLAERAWLGGPDLLTDVLIEVRDGRFASMTPNGRGTEARPLWGVVLPGLVNTHSHLFHRVLRGRTQETGGDFWLWRDLMFEVADSLDPKGYERLATAVLIEMAMAGVTTVGEFHYLHHQPGGMTYGDANEMSHAVIRAARRVGLRICLLDTGYFRAGFDETPLHPVQRRFADSSPETWLDRVEELSRHYASDDDVTIGVAPHSVRAVPVEILKTLAGWRETDVPTHIHLSEQPRENADCVAATGLTPTGVLEECGLLGPSTTAIHATHLTDEDIAALGGSGTGICYCATTERDLGDGIGPVAGLSLAGSSITVGSDSHAVIDIFEEIRGIEMHQRLLTGSRGHFSPAELLSAATVNGSRALGFGGGGMAVGHPADFVVVDTDSTRLAGMDPGHGVASIVYAATGADVAEVFVGGRRIVSQGEHPAWDEYRGALAGS